MAEKDPIVETIDSIIQSFRPRRSASDRKAQRFFRQFKRQYVSSPQQMRRVLIRYGLDLENLGEAALLDALTTYTESQPDSRQASAALGHLEYAVKVGDLGDVEVVGAEEEEAAEEEERQKAIWAQAEADLDAREDALYGVGDDDLGLLAGEGPDGGSPTDADNPYTEAPLLDLAQQTGVLGMEEGNPLGVEQDTTYKAGEEIIVDGEVVPTFDRAQPGAEETFSFEEMVKRRQRGVDQGEEVISDPMVAQMSDRERAPGVNPDGENNWRSTAGNALGLLGTAAGLAQPFVDQYMQKDWEDMLRASARGDTVARQEGAIASGRALQGMMGSSLGRRDISPALAMRNAQTSSRNLLRDIYGQQLVASAQERRLAEEKLAQIRSQRWQKALGTVGELGSQAGAWLSKEGAKQSAGPVTAGTKNSGGGGGDATGQ